MLMNFSWLVPGQIAGVGQPGNRDCDLDDSQEQLVEDLQLLHERGIRAIVSLTERPLKERLVQARNMAYLHLPVADMQPPTLADAIKFVEFAETAERENRPLAVHCGAGMGRTGTMLACYLVRKGLEAQQAMAQIRQKRPGSVETAEQESVVREYADYLKTLVKQPA